MKIENFIIKLLLNKIKMLDDNIDLFDVSDKYFDLTASTTDGSLNESQIIGKESKLIQAFIEKTIVSNIAIYEIVKKIKNNQREDINDFIDNNFDQYLPFTTNDNYLTLLDEDQLQKRKHEVIQLLPQYENIITEIYNIYLTRSIAIKNHHNKLESDNKTAYMKK